MKFDDLLALYLYEHKTLRLQELGTFQLDSNVTLPQESEKGVYYPIEGLSFTYNPKGQTDEEVISFMVKKLGKIQPLVRSDIESYLSNIRQFVNIGKPYTIEGIGTLLLNNRGQYEFSPGTFSPVKEELSPHKDNAEHQHRQKIKQRESNRSTKIIFIAITCIVVAAALAFGVYTLINNRSETAQIPTSIIADTVATAKVDTLVQSVPDSRSVAEPLPTGDTANYKLIFETTGSKQRVYTRTNQLKTYGFFVLYDSLSVGDSLMYRMYAPRILSNADTAVVKDSLSKFLGRRIRFERQ